jgi:microcystin-dependent protein
MPSTPTSRLRLEKMADGENDGTWGSKMAAVLDRVDDAIAGLTTINTTGGTTVLTANNFTADQARSAILVITGALASNAIIQIPTATKIYTIRNATTGPFALIVKTASGIGAVAQRGLTMQVMCDGADCHLISGSTAAGAIEPFATEVAPPGWSAADGGELSRTSEPGLFAVIGTTFGAGNGVTTYNKPDLRGLFVRGWANGSGNDPDRATRTNRGDGIAGDHVGTRQTDAFKLHGHPARFSGGTSSPDGNGGINLNNNGNSNHTFTGEPTDTFGQAIGGSGGSETRPTNIALLYCIRL